jgi:hypothetical protein
LSVISIVMVASKRWNGSVRHLRNMETKSVEAWSMPVGYTLMRHDRAWKSNGFDLSAWPVGVRDVHEYLDTVKISIVDTGDFDDEEWMAAIARVAILLLPLLFYKCSSRLDREAALWLAIASCRGSVASDD